jgi:hypothetical protein
MEVLHSFETSALTIATRRNIPEDGILHSHRRENLKSYINYGIYETSEPHQYRSALNSQREHYHQTTQTEETIYTSKMLKL